MGYEFFVVFLVSFDSLRFSTYVLNAFRDRLNPSQTCKSIFRFPIRRKSSRNMVNQFQPRIWALT